MRRQDSEALNRSLYLYMRTIERRNDRIHNRYRVELTRIVRYHSNRGNLNQQLSPEEFVESLMALSHKKDILRSQASPMASRIIDRVFNLILQTRMEVLISEITEMMIQMNIELERNIASALEEGYGRTYYQTSFNIARRSRVAVPIPRLNDGNFTEVLSEDWSGQVWQSRQWNNNQIILESMLSTLDYTLHHTTSVRNLIGMLLSRFEYSRWQTTRILRTEFSHYSNVGIDHSYEINDIRWYEYIATLDCCTCGDCGELDGEIFQLRRKRIGVNAPLLHPHCRCTTAPTFPEEEESRWRRARRENDRNEIIDGNITYNEWFRRFVR